MDDEDRDDNFEARIAAIDDELKLLKETVLPMLLEIREQLLTRDREV